MTDQQVTDHDQVSDEHATDEQRVTLIILGGGGDLTDRLLLPGLSTLLAGDPQWRVSIIGVGRSEVDTEDYRNDVRAALSEGNCSAEQVERVVAETHYESLDVTEPDRLADLLDRCAGAIVLYFALPPSIVGTACEQLRGRELPDRLRLAVEKPFGTDLESAAELNGLLRELLPEDRIFRIDHFLGEAAVLDLIGLRFANRILEPVWNATHVERIEVVADETLALEGRADYYDGTGALIDMIQSHLLLVLTLATMEEPARIDADEVRDLMVHTLRATRIWGDDPVRASRRARYTAGRIGDRDIPDYTAEEGVDPDLETETLAEVRVEIDNQRWSGVPILLRSGKALGEDRMQLRVVFRPVNHLPEGLRGEPVRNVLTLDLLAQTLSLDLATNGDADAMALTRSTLDAQVGGAGMLPYGEILERVFTGDPLLSVRGDVVEECWRIVAPVVAAWKDGAVPLDAYAAGTSGPDGWEY